MRRARDAHHHIVIRAGRLLRLEHAALLVQITGESYRGVKARKLASRRKARLVAFGSASGPVRWSSPAEIGRSSTRKSCTVYETSKTDTRGALVSAAAVETTSNPQKANTPRMMAVQNHRKPLPWCGSKVDQLIPPGTRAAGVSSSSIPRGFRCTSYPSAGDARALQTARRAADG
jgi:hypothetical protein